MYKKYFQRKIIRESKAFTIIEFLIYFSILAILLLVISSITFQVLSSKIKLETVQEVNQNARMAVEQITDRIHNAQSINSPVAGQSSPTLSLVLSDNTKNPTVFDVVSGVLRIREGSSSPIAIS